MKHFNQGLLEQLSRDRALRVHPLRALSPESLSTPELSRFMVNLAARL